MSKNLRRFHLAFPIKDIAGTRHFYVKVLGCTEGRSTSNWIDFDFYGNQISGHICPEPRQIKETSKVDGIDVPLQHFGAIVSMDEFDELTKRVKEENIEFVIEPTRRYPDQKGEQMTMFIKDNSGNGIEFKAFKHEDEIFSKQL